MQTTATSYSMFRWLLLGMIYIIISSLGFKNQPYHLWATVSLGTALFGVIKFAHSKYQAGSIVERFDVAWVLILFTLHGIVLSSSIDILTLSQILNSPLFGLTILSGIVWGLCMAPNWTQLQ